ncbi:MAG: SUMF1/EgtB/PvdO family nonheme iron enzyme, partial [Deltaproteobacteria bacterium]|nr:SUMF1/EgtB/PvdO family nonheme iron enzyme [Deltaproteobacteria bacterium]
MKRLPVLIRSLSFTLAFGFLFLFPVFAEETAPKVATLRTEGGMVLLPGGEFWMGTDSPRSMPNERPKHRVKLSQFWIDRTDVTNADYEAFVKQTGYKTVAE